MGIIGLAHYLANFDPIPVAWFWPYSDKFGAKIVCDQLALMVRDLHLICSWAMTPVC